MESATSRMSKQTQDDPPPLLARLPDLHDADPQSVRRCLHDCFVSTFDRYESLFETLACDAAYYELPITLRHPLIFYFGHTATFFINIQDHHLNI